MQTDTRRSGRSFAPLLAIALAASLVAGCANEKTPETLSKPQEGEHDEAGHAAHHASAESVVQLDSAAQQAIGLKTSPVETRTLATELATTGEFLANANREAHVTTRITGRVASIAKNIGEQVAKGETLAVLDSVELGQAQTSYLQAYARWELAASTAKRQHALLAGDLIARKEVIAADNALKIAQIELDSAKNQLSLYGFGATRTAHLARTRRLDPTIALTAPIAGLVLSRHLTIGELLRPEAEQPAFTLSDVSALWVDATVFEKDLARVKVGQRATVTTPAFPDRRYAGRVSLVSLSLEKASRTATARVVVQNPDARLKPEMTATIRIAVGEKTVLAIPAGALVRDADETYVFIEKTANQFEKRPVAVGEAVGDWLPVETGLQRGEALVTAGSFTLKAELTKEAYGDHD